MMNTVLTSGSSININLGNSLSKPSDERPHHPRPHPAGHRAVAADPAHGLHPDRHRARTDPQALGLQTTPPNQVIAGLALIFSLFIMAPTLNQMNHDALQPYLHGKETVSQAYNGGRGAAQDVDAQADRATTSWRSPRGRQGAPRDAPRCLMAAIIPAFLLSQLKSGFIIGFVIFIPFLIIDLVVASTLMSMGVVMLPPTLVSLPVQAAAVRHGERLGARRPLTGGELPMNEAHLMDIAAGAMIMTAKLALPILLASLVVGLVGLAVPVGDPDPGGDPHLRPQAGRARPGPHGRRALDARPVVGDYVQQLFGQAGSLAGG